MNTNAETIERILNAIDEAERTQTWVARKAGIAVPTLRRKLKGGGELTVREVGAIAHCLGIKPSDLLPSEFQDEVAA